MKYTDDIYAETGLSPEVRAYVRYNANKALMNVGFEAMFPEEEVNPIVMNGIRNEGSTYDFFSQRALPMPRQKLRRSQMTHSILIVKDEVQ